jgi:glycosyltransferase involved in cell wall biosynthesis
MGTYINGYADNFPKSYALYDYIRDDFKDFDLFVCEHRSRDEVADELADSFSTLHLKDQEGYGFSVIESMARGRPVFLYRFFARGKSYVNWAIEGETCFYFGSPDNPNFTDDDYNELVFKIRRLSDDEKFRHSVQEKCSLRIRELINNEEQIGNFKNFLENAK